MLSIRRILLAIMAVLMTIGPAQFAYSAVYYVRNGGSDAADGKSHETAFRTLGLAFNMLRNGDELYLLSGSAWKPFAFLSVTRDNVKIGAYHVDAAGDEALELSGRRPEIDGQMTVPSPGTYNGLVHITGNNSVIKNLTVKNSGGLGVRFSETSNGLIENVEVNKTYFFGIQAFKSIDIEIRDCEVIGFGQGAWQNNRSVFPNGISIRTSDNVIVADNIIREGWGEAINSYYGSNHVVIENNVIFATRNVGIYIDSSIDVIVRRNLILGTSLSDYHRYGDNTSVGPGIAINNEKFEFEDYGGDLPLSQMSKNINIYNNLVAATASGVAIYGQHPLSSVSNVTIAHNSFVDNNFQLGVVHKGASDIEVANNIFLSISANGKDYKIPQLNSDVRFQSNYWSQGVPDSPLRGSGDIHSGLTLEKMQGWDSLTYYNQVDWRDFLPANGSSTIGSASRTIGLSITSDYNGHPFSLPPDIGALALGSGGPRKITTPKPPILNSD